MEGDPELMVLMQRLFPREPALENILIVAATEMTTDEDVERLAAGLREALA